MLFDIEKNGVSQSMLMNFLKCRQFTKLYIEKYRPIISASYFRYGEICHAILEEIYKQIMNDKRNEVPTNAEIIKLIDEKVEDYRDKNKIIINPEEEQLAEIQSVMIEKTLSGYFKYWYKEDFKKVKWLEQEKEFKFKLNNNVVPIRGIRDAAYSIKEGIYLFETKTKAQIDESTLSELLAFDFQVMLYAVSMNNDYGKYPIACRYNIIRRPSNRLGKNENLEQFGKRLEEEVKKRPEYYYVRYMIDISKKQLEEFQKELEIIINEFVAWNEGKLKTFKNIGSCVTKFGVCQYLPICAYNDFSKFRKTDEVHSELMNENKTGGTKNGNKRVSITA